MITKFCLNVNMKNYRHINERDRIKIAKLKSYKLSVSEIARRTGFNKSSISRELRRNGGDVVKVDPSARILFFFENGMFDYRPQGKSYRFYSRKKANSVAKWRRRIASKRVRIEKTTKAWIKKHLRKGWSPQQIAGRSKIDGPQPVSQ